MWVARSKVITGKRSSHCKGLKDNMPLIMLFIHTTRQIQLKHLSLDLGPPRLNVRPGEQDITMEVKVKDGKRWNRHLV